MRKEKIMSKYVVCVFDDGKTAYEGAKAVQELDHEGSLAVYEAAIVSKDEKGSVRVEDWEEDGPMGTVTGMFLGSLVGVVAGPVGMAVGAAAGSLRGVLFDVYNAGVGDDFVDDVSRELAPGKYAVLAEADEEWILPLDTRMKALGATVYRSWRIDVEDEQIEQDMEANRREWEDLKEEWRTSSDDAKAKLKTKVDAARAKLEALDKRGKAKLEAFEKEFSVKVKKLEEQIAKANADRKAKYQKRLDELKAGYERRMGKLKEAVKLTGEALA
jgi:uncharacterized membrane protein